MAKQQRVRSAAVYVRISSDPDGSRLGVARQREDCEELAQRLGWAVGEVYEDNDVSAYSGKRRPGYERMLADVEDGYRDAVICYHQDRLHRRPIELERFLEVCDKAQMTRLRFVAGAEVDIANGDGLLVLRMLSAVSANESATKSRRVRRKMEQVAAAGLPHGGNQRPFGFEPDRITHNPTEADVVRQMVARFLAGESVRSLTMWLQAEGPSTVSGKPWNTTSVKAILVSQRNAGLRAHRGEVVAKAVWDPIITETDHRRVLARYETMKRSGRRTPRTYLLSGMLRCGKCEAVLYSARREWCRRYVCVAGPDHRGCGRLTVVAEPLEQLVTEALLYRLDSAELAAALAGRADADDQAVVLSTQISEDQVQLDELAELYAARRITQREWMTARAPIESRIAEGQRRLSRLTRSDALAGLVGHGQKLRSEWAGLDLSRQAAIAAAVIDRIIIGPGTGKTRTLDPARVDIAWRL